MSLATATTTPEPVFQPGQKLAQKYRIDRLIGKGGMAAVWEGTNERTGKRVALKVILQSLASHHEAEHLFHFEALATSRINHPNVVTVFDVIEHQSMACIVMELLEGESFGAFIARKGPLSVEETLAVLLPAMRGVAAAHAEGIVHRDIKPANIFLCMGPDRRVLATKVLDFGVALMAEHIRDGAKDGAETTAGTPVYMSPEHLTGQRVDGRTDVYSFGVLLYEALTGDAPFVGEVGASLFQRIINEPPPPVTGKRPDLPPSLVRIIHKALAKAPTERFHTVDSMIDALEDELMRRPGLPRSLTPLAGITLFDSGKAGSTATVKVPMSKSPESSSGPHSTQILFGLSTTPARGRAAKPAPASAEPPIRTGPNTVEVEPPLPGTRPTLKKLVSSRPRIAIGAAIVIALGVSIGLAVARKAKPHVALSWPQPTTPAKPVANSTQSVAPAVTPHAAAPSDHTLAEPGGAAVAVPAAAEPAGAAESDNGDRTGPATAARSRGVEPASRSRRANWDPFAEAPAASSSTKPARAPDKAATPAPTGKNAGAKASPRAGRLSADDF